ncbi:MAG: M1 family metallopeptidase [Anaerolineales bacterium]
MLFRRLLYVLIGGIWLFACDPLPATPFPSLSPTLTATPFLPASPPPLLTVWSVQPTLPPTLTPSPTASATPFPTLSPSPTPSPPASSASPMLARPHYRLYARLDYEAHHLEVEGTIEYPNLTGTSLSSLVLAVEPNRWPGCFSLQSLTAADTPLEFTLEGHRLEVHLPHPLPPQKTLLLDLRYNLDLPPKRMADAFGYNSWQQNYVHWYPFIVPYRDGWLLHDPWHFGEHLAYDVADFDVYLHVPEGITIAAPALPVNEAGWQHYTLSGARTFTFSAGHLYQVDELKMGTIPIRSYFLATEQAAGQHITLQAVRFLTLYTAHLTPYPYPVLSIVESEASDGAEFDGLVFLARRFYQEFRGGTRNNLTAIGIHEIAHQWWFGLVGNDQALEPWLDEALTLYSEALFYEWAENAAKWWWDFRVNYFEPQGFINISIYDGGNFRSYTNAVYLRGGQFLQALRERSGDEAFFAFLRDYAQQMQGKIATRQDFFRILSQHTSQNLDDLIGEYFYP